jgi:hypothetical protein
MDEIENKVSVTLEKKEFDIIKAFKITSEKMTKEL